MVDRALVFGSVAEAYERYRAGYPEAVADLVLAHAARPVRTALEIGAGTGKATRLFASRGIAVTATDPDAGMLAELSARLPDVETVRCTLETAPTGRRHDLVYAAAALHWTDPATRWPAIAELLAPEGVFASFGGVFTLTDPGVEDAVLDARAPWLEDDDVVMGVATDTPPGALSWPGDELLGSDLFTDVRQETVERSFVLPAGDYIGYLSTVSAYLQLAAADRAALFERVLQVLPSEVTIEADVVVHLARRAPRV